MSQDKNILISGAGPSGLSMAIFLKQYGFQPRIIDKKTSVSPWSKALAVNPRTLTILDEFGIAKRFLENGRKMHAMNIWRNGKVFFRNEFKNVSHKYPFILIQSQRESELILAEELEKRGVQVEPGKQFLSSSNKEQQFATVIRSEDDETYFSDYLVGADGSHSEVRQQCGIEFPSFGYRGTWELYDVELETSLPRDEANLFFFNEGGMIMIRIKDNLWRAAGNLHNMLNYLPKGTRVGNIPWQTKFNIGHRIAAELTKGNSVIIGDAAHIHSPFGGRGMNLGIEDAFLASQCIRDNRLEEYSQMRLPYLHKTVRRINMLTNFIAGTSGIPLIAKKCSWMAKPFLPLARPLIRNFVLGLT